MMAHYNVIEIMYSVSYDVFNIICENLIPIISTEWDDLK